MKIERHRCYLAEVKVKNRATLRPDANLNDGDKIKVYAGWIQDDDQNFPGQFGFMRAGGGYWIPEEDLVLIEEISSSEYYENN